MNIIHLGSPGVGKGTYAEIFSERLNVPHISTGVIFREEIKKGTELGRLAASLIHDGNLVPDDVTNQIVRQRLAQEDCNEGYILDGYPRNVDQANVLETFSPIDRVLYFVAADEVIMRRLGGRMTCSECQKIYHVTNIKPKVEGICDLDGATLEVRPDQTPEAIKKRLEIYREQTAPLIAHYKEKGLLREVDSTLDLNIGREQIIASIEYALKN